ncbi:larval cuticle protein LCP-17-like [Anoplophora glabripennis]|uniref:larval cuticle protein LCP-17-like n=1 Tax=Anoplophora glabripennis TaxID=217634 RepID=UPI00087419A6|nr:larval cuticle protein LCP-17-like [Anoplophora glabripennis]
MCKLVILSLLLVAIYALPQNTEINRQFQDIYPDGSYEYLYETGNGIFVQEEGKARSINEENVDLVVQGSFLYTAPDGKEIHLSYVADENGYRPQGDHLPTPPPIPPQIQRALDWIAARSLQKNR